MKRNEQVTKALTFIRYSVKTENKCSRMGMVCISFKWFCSLLTWMMHEITTNCSYFLKIDHFSCGVLYNMKLTHHTQIFSFLETVRSPGETACSCEDVLTNPSPSSDIKTSFQTTASVVHSVPAAASGRPERGEGCHINPQDEMCLFLWAQLDVRYR